MQIVQCTLVSVLTHDFYIPYAYCVLQVPLYKLAVATNAPTLGLEHPVFEFEIPNPLCMPISEKAGHFCISRRVHVNFGRACPVCHNDILGVSTVIKSIQRL